MKFYSSLLALAVITASCTHVYYAPNTANAPLLSEKGETRVNALYSSGNISEFTGGEVQVAYGFSKNFGAMINGMSVSNSEELTSWNNSGTIGSHIEKGSGSYVEFAGGYFKTLDKAKKFVFETYGGVGLGTANNDYGFDEFSKVNSTKIFVQPSIGYKSKHFEMALVPKLSFINWKVKESSFSNQNSSHAEPDLSAIKNKPHFVAFEPALLFRAGGKNVKAQASLSFSNGPSAYGMDDLTETLNASFGISVNIKRVKK